MQENILDEAILENQEFVQAKLWQRFLALLTDGIILWCILLVSQYFLYLDQTYLISSFSALLYKPGMEYLYGGTLGKMLFRIKVVSTDLQAPSITQVILRNVFGILNQFVRLVFLSLSFDLLRMLNLGFTLPFNLTLNAAFFTLLMLLDAIVLFFNSNNQALHDLIAKTYVIQK